MLVRKKKEVLINVIFLPAAQLINRREGISNKLIQKRIYTSLVRNEKTLIPITIPSCEVKLDIKVSIKLHKKIAFKNRQLLIFTNIDST